LVFAGQTDFVFAPFGAFFGTSVGNVALPGLVQAGTFTTTDQTAITPEPASLMLMLAGLLALFFAAGSATPIKSTTQKGPLNR
jgi:hypothetical protein